MSLHISIDDFFTRREEVPVIDVRSPSEYAQGHIPGAHNIPLFTDAERAAVGKEYKQRGAEFAVLKGLKYIRPKLKDFVRNAAEISDRSSLIVHCWRGGLRSENMALLFRISGICCDILEGGYRSYRRNLREQFRKSLNMVVLGGFTGSGKTDLLNQLNLQGQQTIDLEGLAHHKGSAFGSLGQKNQPSNEQFENNLFEKWRLLDPAKTLWLEDESKAIGSVFIPDEIFTQMRNSPVLKIEMGRAQRVKRLEREYAAFPPEALKLSIEKIGKRLGDKNRKIALSAIDQSNFATAIELSLAYYDKTYRFGLSRRDPQSIYPLALHSSKSSESAAQIVQAAKKWGLV